MTRPFALPDCLPICDPPTLGGSPADLVAAANRRWPQVVLLRLGNCDSSQQAQNWLDKFVQKYQGHILLNAGTYFSTLEAGGVQGRHFPASILKEDNLIPSQSFFGISTHSEDEVVQAALAGASWVTISPLAATQTHPDTLPMAWHTATRCARLARRLGMHAYALGGLLPADLAGLQSIGFDGVAGIRGFLE